MTEPEPDETLVRRHLGGEAGAFAQLVERHERRMYNVALRMVGRPEDAQDATQDAFLTALRKLDQFRGEAAFSTWLHRVTVNACYDLLRKRARSPMLHVVGTGEDAPQPEAPPTPDHAEGVAVRADVEGALAEIPMDFRTVVVLHDLQDLAYEEIAAILGVPVGTVKSRLHRGRIAFARAMGISPREPEGRTEASETQP